jgi:hypothetical protein
MKLNLLYFPVMKTWMLYGRVGYAKWVNFEHLYPKCCGIQVQIITLTTSNMGNYGFFCCSNQKGCGQKEIEIKCNDPDDINTTQYLQKYKHSI